jgi:hypothetical protein
MITGRMITNIFVERPAGGVATDSYGLEKKASGV